jgi:uncharacterized protein (TIRG00374 family)
LKKQLLTILKFLFFLGLGIFLVWLAVKDKTDEELNSISLSIRQADYVWILISVVISGLSHLFRAMRWRILLEPLGHNTKISNTFFAVMVGYLANCAVPRLGEVTRCGVLTRYEKVPFTQGFGSVIAERALDVVCLILLFFLMLGLEFTRISGIADKLIFSFISRKIDALAAKPTFLVIAVISFSVLLILFYIFRKKINALLSGKLRSFFHGLWLGLKSVKDVNRPVAFVVHTILIWLMYVLQVYLCFLAFEETAGLGFTVAVVITVFGSLGVAVVPGGTGAYQYIVIMILTSVYLVAEPAAFAFAWSVWAAQIALILALGLISVILLPVLNKNKLEEVTPV